MVEPLAGLLCSDAVQQYSKMPHQELFAIVQPFLDHLRLVWCRYEPRKYEYVLKFFAHMIQRPVKQIPVAIAAVSQQGAGKTCVLALLSASGPTESTRV